MEEQHIQLTDYLKSLISVLPHSPGIYQFYDKNSKILYIGKAKDLFKRVSSYFTKNHDNTKTYVLVKKIVDIKHIVVTSEEDALLLENSLIKKYQPRYNILLKDDKSFPWLVIKNENFPRLFLTRHFLKDGSLYFGPYASYRTIRTILDFIKQQYKIRSCKLNLSDENIQSGKFKLCLEYHIGNCKAPCEGKIEKDEYAVWINEIINILKGNISCVIKSIRDLMLKFSEEYSFEKAHELKSKLQLMEKFQAKSTIVNPSISNVDVFSIIDDEEFGYVNFLKVVQGTIIQVHTIELKKKLDESKPELLLFAITEIRSIFNSNAPEIIIPFELEIPFKDLTVIIPQRGDKKKLLDLSIRNVLNYRQEKLKQLENINPGRHTDRILNTLKDDLRLSDIPVHIECFDNSNLQGKFPVASCVVFRNGKPFKKDYRHFNIKTVEGIDDFSSMSEIVFRRYKRLLDENSELPQLIVIDGGKGQLTAALESLEKLNLRGKIAIIGIAKKLEEIYFPDDSVPLYLDKNSESLKIIQNIRNEAHRFGITFHRNKRSSQFITSELNTIDGIGEKTVLKLLQEFKSVKNIKELDFEKLSMSIGASKATLLLEYFGKNKINS